jgi:putative transposase
MTGWSPPGPSSTAPPRFADLIEGEPDAEEFRPLRRSELIGRPLGSAAFVAGIEKRLGRTLAPAKRGRKPRPQEEAKGVNTGVSP